MRLMDFNEFKGYFLSSRLFKIRRIGSGDPVIPGNWKYISISSRNAPSTYIHTCTESGHWYNFTSMEVFERFWNEYEVLLCSEEEATEFRVMRELEHGTPL